MDFSDQLKAVTPPARSVVIEALTEGLVVLDTNILLNFYEITSEASDSWFEILHALGNRLYIPGQTAFEFWKNRVGATEKSDDLNNLAGELKKTKKLVKTAHNRIVEARGVYGASKEESQALTSIEKKIESLANLSKSHQNQRRKNFSRNPKLDSIVARLGEVLERGGQVGDYLEPSRFEELFTEADRRFEIGLAPGYEDKNKNKNRYGDFIVWKQILEFANKGNLDVPGEGFIVFVTNDTKSDWFQTAYSEGDAFDWTTLNLSLSQRAFYETRIPKQELSHEAFRHTGRQLIMLTPLSFTQLAGEALGIHIAQEVTDSVRESGFLPGTFTINGMGATAVARVGEDLRTTEVEKGSTMRIDEAQSIPDGYRKLRQEIIATDAVVQLPDDELYEFSENYSFTSPSAAASAILGAAVSGPERWVHDGLGKPLKELDLADFESPDPNQDSAS